MKNLFINLLKNRLEREKTLDIQREQNKNTQSIRSKILSKYDPMVVSVLNKLREALYGESRPGLKVYDWSFKAYPYMPDLWDDRSPTIYLTVEMAWDKENDPCGFICIRHEIWNVQTKKIIQCGLTEKELVSALEALYS